MCRIDQPLGSVPNRRIPTRWLVCVTTGSLPPQFFPSVCLSICHTAGRHTYRCVYPRRTCCLGLQVRLAVVVNPTSQRRAVAKLSLSLFVAIVFLARVRLARGNLAIELSRPETPLLVGWTGWRFSPPTLMSEAMGPSFNTNRHWSGYSCVITCQDDYHF